MAVRSIPDINWTMDAKERLFYEALKELIEVSTAQRGNFLDSAATKRDLVDAGLITVSGTTIAKKSADSTGSADTDFLKWLEDGNPVHSWPHVANTADFTITAAENGTLYSNTGATGTINGNLPPATAGLQYGFVRHENFLFRAVPNGTDTITSHAAGIRLQLAAQYQSAILKCVADGTWDIIGGYEVGGGYTWA